jgi:peptidoglycan/xylan/chitin deacetylase (PgdA/CDA1 family)
LRTPAPALVVTLFVAAVCVAGCGGDGGDGGRPETQAQERPLPTTATAPSEPEGPAQTTPGGEEEPQAPEKPPREARPTAIQEGTTKGKKVALTFDADMTPDMQSKLDAGQAPPQYNAEVIRQLRRYDVPATLFMTGMWAKLYPDKVRSLAQDPLFTIGNHTYDHAAFTSDCYGLASVSDPGEKEQEIARTARVLRKLTGEEPFWMRFPGLCHSDVDLQLVADEGEQVVDGLGSGDAFQSDPQVIVDTVMREVQPGSIIVMHMMGPPNAPASGEALKTLIPALRDEGYDLVSLDRLISRK